MRRLGAQRRMVLAAGLSLVLAVYAISSSRLPITKSVFADSQRVISLHADGQKRIFPTEAETVGEVLERIGIELGEGDLVEPGAQTYIPPVAFNINVYRAQPVVVDDEGRLTYGYSAYRSPRLIAEHLGVGVFDEDELILELVDDFILTPAVGAKITIKRAIPFRLDADGRNRIVRTQAKTLGEALESADISLGPDDIVTPSLGTAIEAGMSARITRIKESEEVKEETVTRPVRTVYDDQAEVGHQTVREPGRDGKRKATYKVRYENGHEVSRQLLGVEVITAPVSRVVVIGTAVSSEIWFRLRMCESGNIYSRNSGNGYYGAYQFLPSTWDAYAPNPWKGTLPHLAPPAAQDEAARNLQSVRGWAPWPGCRARLGLP